MSFVNKTHRVSRRQFIAGSLACGSSVFARASPCPNRAELHLTLSPYKLEIASNRFVQTTAYTNHSTDSVLYLEANCPTEISITNATNMQDFVHWHGLRVPALLDGTPEEDSLGIAPGATLQYTLPAQRPGLGFAHSHAMSGHGLACGPYSGQFLPVAIGNFRSTIPFDREVFLTSHEWLPTLVDTAGEERSLEAMQHLRVDPDSEEEDEGSDGGWDIVYKAATLNGKVLGAGEPIRVRAGERILFRIVNASATEPLQLALPGHRFLVLALDGYPVPTPVLVEQLELGVGERIDAVVIMNTPGIWVLGSPDDRARNLGMGVVIEYADRTGTPIWAVPVSEAWDYTRFAATPALTSPPENQKTFRLERRPVASDGFERWEMVAQPGTESAFTTGERSRITLINNTDEPHPMHLHRLPFELASVSGVPCPGIRKDTVVVPAFRRVELDITPEDSGPTLLHCHNQMHMDCGLKTLLHFH
jgi:FtsP/CotA-like multicopper oxidase with cupredoxin domain